MGGTQTAAESQSGTQQTSPITVLVVENETIVALALSEYLRRCGYKVIRAASGEAAQRVFAWASIDAVITDVHLGRGISGFELTTWLREHHPEVRVVLASSVWELAREALGLSGNPMLRKPYFYSEVSASLKKAPTTAGPVPAHTDDVVDSWRRYDAASADTGPTTPG